MKKIFRTAVLGLSIAVSPAPALSQDEHYTTNRIYQQIKDLASSIEFKQFWQIVRSTSAYDDARVREYFNAMRIIESGYYDADHVAKLSLSFCVTADTSALLHLGGQRNNILRFKMNRLHAATQALVDNQGNVNNCSEIYSRFRGPIR